MNIVVNGEDKIIDPAWSVQKMLNAWGMEQSPCAVEINGELVPKRQHIQHQLHEGDVLEIVSLVGGG